MNSDIDFDEVAEAEAQGLPYVLAPRVLSREEWIEQYSGAPTQSASQPSCARALRIALFASS
jgi:hypothetical protein